MLQSGEESTIMVPGHTMKGVHRFEITVESNDPVEPEKKILLKFNIIREVIEEE